MTPFSYLSFLSVALSACLTSASTVPAKRADGFVGTSGTSFTLDGSPFTVVGSNSYWVGLQGLGAADIAQSFADIAATGATVVRTWGFNEVTSASGHPIYYQSWDGATATVNTGGDGVEAFDAIVAAADAAGLKLIVALTNNWADYGGMDVYVDQIIGSGSAHDLFYTDETVISAFKDYVNTFVSRYTDETTILAWELANEPRCKGSTGTTSGTCTTTTITEWATDISGYIKSLDSNHLVGLGDEGFFNEPTNPSYPYQGGEGIDFDANLAISSLDFGTFHAYPIPWGVAESDAQAWGVQWIADHAESQDAAGKPVIIEEFGVDVADQATVYTAWLEEVLSSGLAGDLIWQAGSYLSVGATWDDGYAVYPDDPVYEVLTEHAAALKAAQAA